jgi:flagellar protein FliO/FliZ
MRSGAVTAALILTAGSANAADAANPSLLPSLAQALFGLALVLGLIWLAAWAMKRIAPAGAGSSALLKTVAATAVGQRERVVLVEVQDTWLVLGVAPGSVNTLHVLPKAELPSAVPGPANPFDKLLALAKGRRHE